MPHQTPTTAAAPCASPFVPGNETVYRRWRERKLATRARSADELTVAVADALALRDAERAAIIANCRRANLCFFRFARPPRDAAAFRRLGDQLELGDLIANPCADALRISHVRALEGSRYIPYTRRALQWHTDGYYNAAADAVRAFSMYCVRAAARGGANCYLDPELVYILLRDDDPRYVEHLMHPRAMTLPANVEDGGQIRPARSVPVFSVDAHDGALLTRYTARTRHVQWRAECRPALARLAEILATSDWRIHHRLAASEGVVCNNVLHTRDAFEDQEDAPRLLYRARYRKRLGPAARHSPK